MRRSTHRASRDGYHLSGVKTKLDAARREHDAHNDALAASNALDAVLFDPKSREAADYLVQLRNAVIAEAVIKVATIGMQHVED